VVDDDFFKLNEMAQFLDAEDKKEMNKSKGPTGDEEINMHLFNDEQSNDGSVSIPKTYKSSKINLFLLIPPGVRV
jgi:hypothetical protein